MCDKINNMKEPKVVDIKKYLSAIQKLNKKYVTTERLSKVVGFYPEVIAENLSYFEPTLKMDPSFNLMELVPAMKKFVVDKEEEKNNSLIKKEAIKKKDVEEYESIVDFVYRKMTYAGVVDKNAVLSDKDLRIMKKLISEEQEKRKGK